MQLFKLLRLAFLFSVIILINGCGDGDGDETIVDNSLVKNYDSEASVAWNEVYLQVERYATGYRPCPAPRSLAYMGLAAYEACVTGMPDNNSMASLYPGLSVPKVESGRQYHWPTVVNAVYGLMMPRFFSTATEDLQLKMTSVENTLNAKYQGQVDADVYLRSEEYGKQVGEAFLEWEKTDIVGHDAYKDPWGNYDWEAAYGGVPGRWQPTTPGPGKPMYPYWGDVRTFVITKGERLCKPPIPYSEDPKSAFYAQAIEVYNNSNPAQTYELKWIGEFWSDDLVDLTFSPGPRWIAIATQAISNEKANLDLALECYAKTGMALADASIACWYSKYYWNIERPDNYIRRLIDNNWTSTLNNPVTGDKGFTPPFPAFPSGHSMMGGAGAVAIESVFGSNYEMTDICHQGRTDFIGTPRTFESIGDMATENAISRIWLGVHFRMDSEVGLDFGRTIGRKVTKLNWKKR